MFRGCTVAIAIQLLAAQAAVAQGIPAAIAPPAQSRLVSSHPAKGVQIYACAMKDGAPTWVLKAPDAELVDASGKSFAHHFAGPSWQAVDGSKVVGTLVAKVPSPDPGSIPWLLLSAKATGAGVLAGARFVQRVATSGGVAPAAECTAGQELRVPYTATYSFFE